MLISNFGRALGITKRIAKRLPERAAGARAGRHRPRAPRAACPTLVREHVDGLDGVVHSIAYGNPETLLGGKFLDGPWEDVAQAVQVSAYSLKSLADGLPAADGPGRLGRRAHLRRHGRLAGVRLDGRGQGRRSSRARATWPATSARRASGCNLVSAGPLRTLAAKAIPGFERARGRCGRPRAPLGWDNTDQTPTAQAVVRAAVGLVPGHHRRDRPRRRRLPRHGRLSRRRRTRLGSVRPVTSTRRAAGPGGPQPVLPARRHQADAGHQRAGRGARAERARGSRAGIGLRNARPGAPDDAASASGSPRAAGRPAGPRGRRASRAPPGSAVRVRPDHATRTSSWWPTRGGTATAPRRWASAVAAVLDALPRHRRRRPRSSEAARRASRPPSAGPAPHHDHAAGPGGRGHRHQRQDHDLADDRAHRPHRRASSSAGPTPTASTSTASWSRPATTPARAAPAGCWRTARSSFAVTETARGGILLKGIGLTRNDVSVVTNVTADHLGLQGIDTVDQLAEVKAVVPRITKKAGWAVLNADDPRVFAMRLARPRPSPWVFSRDPDSPAIREVLNGGGRATTVIDGWVAVLAPGADPDPLVELVDVPMTLAGLSRFNVENALAAASAALAIGIPRDVVVEGLRTFRPDAEHNPGRMNFFSVGEVSVVIDLAHNEAGLEALLEIMSGVRRPGARLLLGLGAVGRPPGRPAREARRDRRARRRRGGDRPQGAVPARPHRRGARGAAARRRRAGRRHRRRRPTRPSSTGLAGAGRAGASPATWSALMCHAERQEVYDWLAAQGGTADSPEKLRDKVRAAGAPPDQASVGAGA